MDLHAAVQRAAAAAGVKHAQVEPLVAMLRGHVSTSTVSHHIAQHSKSKVQERASDGARFAALHDELRARGVPELDKLTIFLQRVAEEKAVVEMLRLAASASSGGGGGGAGGSSRSASGFGKVGNSAGAASTKATAGASLSSSAPTPTGGSAAGKGAAPMPAAAWEMVVPVEERRFS